MEIISKALLLTAVSLGFIHTVLGPDHYLPFIALSKSNHWSYRKTIIVSLICGLAHCLSSVAIGFLGIALGVFVGRLESLESFRGNIASYLMIAFGLAYLVWAIKRFYKNKSHSHNGIVHSHNHHHSVDKIYNNKSKNLFWGIFIVFLFGPCEPLIPLLMYPASKFSVLNTALVAIAFTFTTVSTMLVVVTIGYKGLSLVKFEKIEPYTHLLASSTIVLCGLLIIAGL